MSPAQVTPTTRQPYSKAPCCSPVGGSRSSRIKRTMRLFFSLITACCCLCASALAEDHTNAVLKATFTLTAYVQEDTNSTVWTISTRKFGNTDIINAVTTDLGLPASDFTSNSLILLATDVLTNHHLAFNLRSLSGVDTDISSGGTTNMDIS